MVESPDVPSEEYTETSQKEDKAIDRITRLLDSEIARVRSEYERPGWTRWALLGGIASAIWLIADTIEQGTFEAGNASILFLAFSLLFYGLTNLGSLLEPSRPDSSAAGRFRLTNRWFARDQASLLLVLAHLVVVIVIAHSFRDRVLWPFVVTVYALCGLLALALALALALTYLPYPLHLRATLSSTSRVFNLVLAAGGLVPAAAYFHSLSQSPTAVTVDDFRIAALPVALYYLLRRLVGLRGETPILKSLIATRRELLLGRIDTEIATQQTDIALAGLQVSDILHEDVEDLLDLWRTYDLGMQETSKKVMAIRATIKRVAQSEEEPSEHTLSIVESLFQSVHSHLDKGSETLDEIKRRLERFDSKAMLLARSATEARPAVREVVDRVDLAAHEALRRHNDLVERSNALMQFAEEALGAPLNDDTRQGA